MLGIPVATILADAVMNSYSLSNYVHLSAINIKILECINALSDNPLVRIIAGQSG
jgi:hypothetical protein